jgi:hypothetical protein
MKLVFHPKVVVLHHVNPVGLTRDPYILGSDTGRFLMKSVQPETSRDLIGWLVNILAFNLYWIYKTFETGRAEQLAGILGFVQGLASTIKEGR